MSASPPSLGFTASWRQFALLVAVNAFVGAMVGLERTVLPLIAERELGLATRSAALSFLIGFGVAKALANWLAGSFGDRFGRKRVLVAGWLFALPVPPLVMWGPDWNWIVAANLLLGINQGLAWSTTVIMKIDLVGPRNRGLATGLNEFAGYLSVAAAAWATGIVAEHYGLRPGPFYLGIAVVAAGLMLSVLLVKETLPHARFEAAERDDPSLRPARPSGWSLFATVSWRHPALFSACQAGHVNNLNDALAWGALPLLFGAAGLSLKEIGLLAFAYPAAWGLAQLYTGWLSDRVGRKWLIAGGMALQGFALLGIALTSDIASWLAASVLLGIGTAMVYPVLLAVIGDVAHPSWRGAAVGIYRLWRDLGYAAGAILAGVLADRFGLAAAVAAIGVLTVASGAQ
ncbi:MAG TPA: MFS transporter, partial [Gemmatimonadales bacterium]|nr:MFS transporter [Gemmatimonadales bacterium]